MDKNDCFCACCGMTAAEYKNRYPLKVQIAKANPYLLPVGKQFDAQRKEGDGSPFPILVVGNWPSFFHGRTYELKDDEVEIKEGETCIQQNV